jgi:uncharacterized protein (TIGR00251 family)
MTSPLPSWLRNGPGGVELQLHVQPRASRTRAVGAHGDALKLQVAAPPVDGEANAEITTFLARTLGARKDQVELLAGETGRRKRVRVLGVTAEAALRALAPPGS